VQTLQLELQRLEAVASDLAREADAHAQYKRAAQWCGSVAGLMATLGSVSLQHAEQDSLSLELLVSVPLTSRQGAAAAAAPVRAVRHELSFFFEPGTSVISRARLAPASVAIDDVLAAAPCGPGGLKFVVREVRAKLRQHWQRQLLLEELGARYAVSVPAPGEPGVRVALPSGSTLELVVPWGWPSLEREVQLVRVVPGGGGGEEAAALCSAVAQRELPLADLMELAAAVEAAGV
jgi:hypothetical protein